MKDLFEKMPFFGGGLPVGVSMDDKELVKIEAMISSMTDEERRRPEAFVVTSWSEVTSQAGKKTRQRAADYDPRRVARVSRGSGRPETEVKELLHTFATMRQMMVQLGASTGLMGKIPGLKQFQQMKRLAGMDLGALMGGGGGGGGIGELMGGGMGLPMGGGGGGLGLPMGMAPPQVPGLPKGYTLPGTPSAGSAGGGHNNRDKNKHKRQAEKKARKKNRR
jgi:signal recognition particle subunit SRP54